MSINIVIKRKKEYKNVKWTRKGVELKRENSTISDVNVFKDGKNIFKCVCCENGGESTDKSGTDRRIIAREYKLKAKKTTVSLPKRVKEKYKGLGIYLDCDNIIGFLNRGIAIHLGNSPQDTLGCLLFAMIDNKNGTVSNSTEAITKIYDICFNEGLENCKLNIVEI